MGPPSEGRLFVSVFLVVLWGLFPGWVGPVDTKDFFLDHTALVGKYELFLLFDSWSRAQGDVSWVGQDISQDRIFLGIFLVVFSDHVPFDVAACGSVISLG